MGRIVAIAWALSFSAIPGLAAPDGLPDPVFSTVPFDQWLNETAQTNFHWNLHISKPELSSHQRLTARLEVQIDGADLAKRRGEGRLLVLVQLADDRNRLWQNHEELNLEEIGADAKGSNALFTESFFLLPGDYRVSAAVYDAATKEHSVIQRPLHVAALRNDPLPDIWHDLPAVEFLPEESGPDRWYLPSVEGRLKLAAAARRPIDVSLLVNLTPPEPFAGSASIQDRNLGAILPAAKVLSQIEWRNATFNVELLDLARRRIAFRQDDLQSLDWQKAKAALDAVKPGIIDVRSLANRRFGADFFLKRITRKLLGSPRGARVPRVVIVLSASLFFEPGMDVHPIRIAPPPDTLLIYIRYQPLLPARLIGNRFRGQPHMNYAAAVPDELEPLLKSLMPRLFEVSTPEQFHKSLAAILGMIARM